MSKKKKWRIDTTRVIAVVLLIWLVATIVACVSCSTLKNPPIKEGTNTSTTHETNTEHSYEKQDSIIGVPADSASLKLDIDCDSLGRAYIKHIETLNGERIQLQAHLEDVINQLNNREETGQTNLTIDIDCKTDSLNIIIEKLRERTTTLESTIDSLSTVVNKIEYVEVEPDDYRYKSNCTKGFWWLLLIDVGIIVLIILWKFGKNTPFGKLLVGAFKVFTKFF